MSPARWSRDHDAAERRALARRRRRRRVRQGVAWAVLGLAALAVGGSLAVGSNAGLTWLRTHTPLFQVRQVDVQPTRWVPPWEVVAAVGLDPGDDMLSVSPEELADRVRGHPRVADAAVARTLNRTFRVSVVEKPPVALFMNRMAYEVAADGTVLGPPPPGTRPEWPVSDSLAGRLRGVELPLITGVALREVEPGMVLDHPGVAQALDFLARLRLYGKHGETWVSEIWAGKADALVAVTLKGGVSIKIGDGRISPRKLDALLTVLDRVQAEGEAVQYVDARFRNQVIVKRG